MSILAAMVVPHPPIIMPEVGHGEERKIQKTIDAYKKVSRLAAALNPETIVISSPHSILYADYFHISPGERATGNFARFRAPDVSISVNYDTEFVKALSNNAAANELRAGTFGERDASLDHGTLIPLKFIEQAVIDFGKVKFVRIGLSGQSNAEHYRLGQLISQTADQLNRRVMYVASGDLSHKLKSDGPYGYVDEGPAFDEQIMKYISGGDFLSMLMMDNAFCERAAECGLRSFWIMAGALDKKNVDCQQLSYEGPFGVGYGVAWIGIKGSDPNRDFARQLEEEKRRALARRKAEEDEYVRLARLSLETFVRTKKPLSDLPKGLPSDMLDRRAGAFVSLHKNGQLRGCIGTIAPTRDSIALEIVQNAVSACSRDPRFSPVTVDELNELEYSVDVLGEAERV
ncbi:MAG: AmmeMemoRadiSam system protein B, partial [Selenomonadaceae bacterium]|nr:AmmeMemoRadiSam system protein B [Selenomonadaceae bacterium]